MKTLHFLYHELRTADTRYTYVTPVQEFGAQAAFFASVLREAQGGALEHLLPAITFDDGYRSDRELALPILQAHGLTARFFITAGWTGQRAAYMNAAELRVLAAAGHAIGAHGWSHQLLTHCSDAELDRELRGARQTLEETLGQSVTTMSLPGGRFNARVLRACTAAGYTQVFTSLPRADDVSTQPTTVGRLNVRGGTELSWFERMLAADERSLGALARTERIKGRVRQLLGDRAYAWLWAALNRQEAPAHELEQAGAPIP